MPFFKVNRMEFVITKNCNSRCKHCSVINPTAVADNSYADLDKLFSATEKIINMFNISSIMVYGGEPLLFPQITIDLLSYFRKSGVPKRELITNGFISQNPNEIVRVSEMLIETDVTQIFLSIDEFHQEFIPLNYIELFISSILNCGFKNIYLHPAWLVDEYDNNYYNTKTKNLLNNLISKFPIEISKGNVIAPAGYSRKLLSKYYKKINLDLNRVCGEIPYTNSLTDIRNLRFLPNGNINICRGICIGNIFIDDIGTILDRYSPYTNPITTRLLSGGVKKLLESLENNITKIDPSEYYGVCDLCTECIKLIEQK